MFLVELAMGKAPICLVENELIGTATGEMHEIIQEVSKANQKPGQFQILELCNEIIDEEDGSVCDTVLLRAQMKDWKHWYYNGIVVDDITLTNDACRLNTTCIDA